MVTIREISDRNEWNSLLQTIPGSNFFSSFEWGEFKNDTWRPCRLAFFNQNNHLGQVQFLVKTRFRVCFGWASGGLHLRSWKDLPDIKACLEKHFAASLFLLRFHFFEPLTGTKSFPLCQQIRRATRTINSGFSVTHSLGEGFPDTLSTNHRYYLKKARQHGLSFQAGPQVPLEAFTGLHNEMTRHKHLGALAITAADISRLAGAAGSHLLPCLVFQGTTPVAGCLVLLWGKTAYYFLAAASPEGRDVHASFLMVTELFAFLRSQGITHFDFGGITPFDEQAFGVNRFKMGFGGQVIQYLGEWDLSNSRFLSALFNKVYLRK